MSSQSDATNGDRETVLFIIRDLRARLKRSPGLAPDLPLSDHGLRVIEEALAVSETAASIVRKHIRHVELSPGVGKTIQSYAISVCEDILSDLNAAPAPAVTGSQDAMSLDTPAAAPIPADRSAIGRSPWKRGDQRVVCAAMRDQAGRIITGARHFDAVMLEQIKRGPDANAWRNAEQGFIDQFGKFLTREEARTIAEKQGQILEECGGNGIDLYSENLY